MARPRRFVAAAAVVVIAVVAVIGSYELNGDSLALCAQSLLTSSRRFVRWYLRLTRVSREKERRECLRPKDVFNSDEWRKFATSIQLAAELNTRLLCTYFKRVSEFAFKLNHVVNDRLNCCVNTNFLRAIFSVRSQMGSFFQSAAPSKNKRSEIQHASRVTQIAVQS